MKTQSRIITIFIFTMFCYIGFGQEPSTEMKEKFKVYGNCDMCKKKIDAAAKSIDGVTSAKWSVSAKTITVKYDSKKTDLETIKKEIANAGYDTEEFRAKDETYNALHSCCKYERPEPIKN